MVLAEVAPHRSFGDKWKGVADVDLRFRQRYVDLWANDRSREVFKLRSRLVSLTRRRVGQMRGPDAWDRCVGRAP